MKEMLLYYSLKPRGEELVLSSAVWLITLVIKWNVEVTVKQYVIAVSLQMTNYKASVQRSPASSTTQEQAVVLFF